MAATSNRYADTPGCVHSRNCLWSSSAMHQTATLSDNRDNIHHHWVLFVPTDLSPSLSLSYLSSSIFSPLTPASYFLSSFWILGLSFCNRLENIFIMTVFPPVSAVSLSIVVPFGAFDRVCRTKDTRLYSVSGMSRLKPIHIDNVTNQQCSALHSRRAATVSGGSHSSPSVWTLITWNYSLQLLYQRQFLWEGHAAIQHDACVKNCKMNIAKVRALMLDDSGKSWITFNIFEVLSSTVCLNSTYVKYLVLCLHNWL